MTRQRAARIAAALFIVTAALFVIGASSEPNDHHDATEATSTRDEGSQADEGEEVHDESTEGGEHADGAESEEAHEGGGEDETILGIDIESPAAITLAVIASAVLAVGLWFRPVRAVLGAGIAAGIALAVLDIAEITHQVDESNTGLTVIAAVIAAGHLAAAGASGLALRAGDTT